MSNTILFYDRYFNRATASAGDEVYVTIQLAFVSPTNSGSGIWFDNIGDNLGGSNSTNGPLVGDPAYVSIPIVQNMTVHHFHADDVGNAGAEGCIRIWCAGSSYPGPSTWHNSVFHPTASAKPTSFTVVRKFSVHPNATVGTVINAPVSVPPPINTNYDAGELMITRGWQMILTILNTTAPPGQSRTLTIV